MGEMAAPGPSERRGSYQASKPELLRRFRRLQGQVAGISRMVEEERYCPEVLTQLSAAIAALERIGYILLRDHVQHCVAAGLRSGEGAELLDELVATIERFSSH
ncbi:MAG: metal-sensitive transcriptional regulator [Candidatus Dormibacteria bacterium]